MRKTHLLLSLAATMIVGGTLSSCNSNQANNDESEVKNSYVTIKEKAPEEIDVINCDLIKVPTGAYSSTAYYNEKTSDGNNLAEIQHDIGTRMVENLSSYLYRQATTTKTLSEEVLKEILSFDFIAYHTNVNNFGTTGVVYYDFMDNAGKGLETRFVDGEEVIDPLLDEFYFNYKDLMAYPGAYSSDVYYMSEEKSTLSKNVYIQMLNNLNEYLITTLIEGSEVDEAKVKDILSTKFIAYHTNVNNWGTNSTAYRKFVSGVKNQ